MVSRAAIAERFSERSEEALRFASRLTAGFRAVARTDRVDRSALSCNRSCWDVTDDARARDYNRPS